MKKINIAHAPRRTSTVWANTTLAWSELVEKLSTPVRTSETIEQYQQMPKGEQGEIKDVGGFVGGHLRDGRRKRGHAYTRSILTLDVDIDASEAWENFGFAVDAEAVFYTTHSSTPEKRRGRIIILLSRAVSPEEYQAVGRKIAEDIGIDLIDPTTYEPERLMYYPSVSSNGEFIFEHLSAEPLDVDKTLKRYENWRDQTLWPRGKSEILRETRQYKKLADPATKAGIVGAFCRAFPISEAIRRFLPDVYEPSAMHPNRYTYILGESANGLVVYDGDTFAYSHHGTDPAGGNEHNSFDLVRIHKFGELDTKGESGAKAPSYKAMVDWCTQADEVRVAINATRQAEALEAFADDLEDDEDTHEDYAELHKILKLDKSGNVADELSSYVAIMRKHPRLQGIAFNQLAGRVEVAKKLPWAREGLGWTDADEAQLRTYIQAHFGIYSPGKLTDAITTVANERAFHPIREYFKSLGPWDGVKRVETLLIDYLNAADTAYTCEVCKLTLVAAVRRVWKPGTKFDQMLVLSGPQGIGKSMLFRKLAPNWFSDSLSILDMRDKTAAEKLQGNLFNEVPELDGGMRKADIEAVKGFITREDDLYRPAYGRNVESHPRTSVLIGTTNAENGFLRDVTGNRRFWPVEVNGESELHPWDLTPETVNQIWAETLVLEKTVGKLYLTGELALAALEAQRGALETDEREGVVREFLDLDLPETWEAFNPFKRHQFFLGEAVDVKGAKVYAKRDYVSVIEIWCECFNRDAASLTRAEANKVAAILNRIDGWAKPPRGGKGALKKLNHYGAQRVWRRSK